MLQAHIDIPQYHLPRSPTCTLFTKALLLDFHRMYLRCPPSSSSQTLSLETWLECMYSVYMFQHAICVPEQAILTAESYYSPATFSP